MASYQCFLNAKPRHESPAKVFAKLKSKVQREAMCAKAGVFTDNEPQCNPREKLGADFKPLRTATKLSCTADYGKENRAFGVEAQALTLSPMSSPQKTFRYSLADVRSKPADQTPLVTEMGHPVISRIGHTPTKKPPQSRDLISRTPVKMQMAEEESAPLHKLMSPAKMSSPITNRSRKRTWDELGFNTPSIRTKEANAEAIDQPRERRTSAFFTDPHKTCFENSGDTRGLPADLSAPRSISEQRCYVVMEKVPVMSPAKMFAYMKERESKREQQRTGKGSSSSTTGGKLSNEGHFNRCRNTSQPRAHNVNVTEDFACKSVPESRAESADIRSDPPKEVQAPATPSPPNLFEDPLLLNTPQIFIPKKQQPVFKRNKFPQIAKFPDENVIYLKKWFLRKTHKGLFVEGIHSEEKIPWNTNIIVERVSSYVLKTVSGSVYVLVGKLNMHVAYMSDFPKWFLTKFVYGFPENWKTLYEKFLSESKDRKTEKKGERSTMKAKTKSESTSTNLSVTRQRKNSFMTPDSCPPSCSSTKVSRSGRMIKPPLEYWKGGRVILDAHMNVTIHECYNTSICIPEVTTTVSARKSQKLPSGEDATHCESVSEEEVSVPLRKVRVALRRCNQVEVNPEEKPSHPPETTLETTNSPAVRCGRTRSSQRSPVYVDAVCQKQREPEKASTMKSKKPRHNTKRSSGKGRKQTVKASPESFTSNDEQPLEEDFSNNKKKKSRTYRKRHRKILNKSQEGYVSPSSRASESFENSVKELKKRMRGTQNSDATQTQKKCSKTSPPTKTLPKSTQSSRKDKAKKGKTASPQEQNKHKRTQAELVKLQEAVSCNSKQVAKGVEVVRTHSTKERLNRHKSQWTKEIVTKKAAKKPQKAKVEAPKDPVTNHLLISARVGTLKRKQQVREFLEAMPREEVNDIFSSIQMQNEQFENSSMCQSDGTSFSLSVEEQPPGTPPVNVFPEIKTPQCPHITPDMMGSRNRNNGDKMVYQFQKRIKDKQLNVYKAARSSKGFTSTPSVKQTMRRCANTENESFVILEMLPGNDEVPSDSEEEEDFYFSLDD
ncbi:mis18-binding protein 1 isoform X3 [Mastacembelus armatus]|uniref:MIS18 binding protein 1 n=1 Tax=Mastacembelus armatus TaxID=205130 RepID=A0A3Q3RI29_9TELE|nr:mis18-binding protein 1 isoform X3 [Mastacembelus armatus]